MRKYALLICIAAFLLNNVKAQSLPDTTGKRINTAIIPLPKLEDDSYNWYDRHAAVLALKDSINPEILLIGDSITHFWGGQPQLKYTDGSLRQPNGPVSWDKLFGPYRVLNLGFGWDRTQNVLWRLDHGEIAGLHPRIVIINIGTNNTSQTDHAHMNTAPEIVDGILAVYARIRTEIPGAKIILMAIFPRDKDPDSPRRALINEVNKELALLMKQMQVTYLNIAPGMLNADGTFQPGMMLDFTHPTDQGYQVWANAIQPYIETEFKNKSK